MRVSRLRDPCRGVGQRAGGAGRTSVRHRRHDHLFRRTAQDGCRRDGTCSARADRPLHRPGERDRERVEAGCEPPQHSGGLPCELGRPAEPVREGAEPRLPIRFGVGTDGRGDPCVQSRDRRLVAGRLRRRAFGPAAPRCRTHRPPCAARRRCSSASSITVRIRRRTASIVADASHVAGESSNSRDPVDPTRAAISPSSPASPSNPPATVRRVVVSTATTPPPRISSSSLMCRTSTRAPRCAPARARRLRSRPRRTRRARRRSCRQASALTWNLVAASVLQSV